MKLRIKSIIWNIRKQKNNEEEEEREVEEEEEEEEEDQTEGCPGFDTGFAVCRVCVFIHCSIVILLTRVIVLNSCVWVTSSSLTHAITLRHSVFINSRARAQRHLSPTHVVTLK